MKTPRVNTNSVGACIMTMFYAAVFVFGTIMAVQSVILFADNYDLKNNNKLYTSAMCNVVYTTGCIEISTGTYYLEFQRATLHGNNYLQQYVGMEMTAYNCSVMDNPAMMHYIGCIDMFPPNTHLHTARKYTLVNAKRIAFGFNYAHACIGLIAGVMLTIMGLIGGVPEPAKVGEMTPLKQVI